MPSTHSSLACMYVPHVCWQSMSPPSHTATASTSTLCKLLTWHQSGVWQAAQSQGATPGLLHQADWLASLLHGNR
jgi:hypothetical protein